MREGYIPQDEVPAYKPRHRKEMDSLASLPPPGMSVEEVTSTNKPKTKSQKKNEKRKQKRLQAKAEAEGSDEDIVAATEGLHIADADGLGEGRREPVDTPPPALDSEVQPEKEKLKAIRALRKRLKQIEDLQARIDSGELKQPDKDQLAKLARKDELMAELLALEHS